MLTDSQVRSAKKKDKPYRLTDGKGLFLHVATSGTKTWRVRYKFNHKESQIVLGHYPDMSLGDARIALLEVKKNIRAGRNPSTDKLLRKEIISTQYQNTFEIITYQWHEIKKKFWTERHANDVIHSLERDVFPALGGIPINEIEDKPDVILSVLYKIEQRGAIETAHRVRQRMGEIFVFAIGKGICKHNPAEIVASNLSPVKRGRQPAIIELDEAIEMLQHVDDTPSFPVTKLAMRFLLLTAVRPGELRYARWEEFEGLEGDNPVWVIPATRMKMKREHIVPLCPMAVDIIRHVCKWSAGLEFVFPNSRHFRKPMSENALGYLINRAGYYQRHVPHGFRSMFSTIMNEHFPQDRFVIDLVLAHAPKDQVEGAYNRTTHFNRRKELMIEWQQIITKELKPIDELANIPKRLS
ncbi:phage integrase central domain-containing protein [Commensalibacter papalotli (ex Botero et al. 2024)]|uniref:tyrosine-type recombinase/integrase n=1 Tax=Commensalibacter papalotli (ex Botero et al. 2024) TaxID=2972766 RepID=UPI0022FF7C05|nr:integrase arm-type DNA-binding domain-containing protein [Commensalibacter papalotli (ex Botero et al. 2024)]CAI3948766.1 Integrase/recombinase [Commensalibacter papalotli (ex Botero et al. 2024)]